MASRHVTVVGAGIVGVCAALHLQRAGYRVSVVDRLSPGEATSFGNACMLTDSSVIPVTGPGIIGKGLKMLASPNGPLFIRPGYAPKIAPWLLRFVREGRAPRVRRTATALSGLLRDVLGEHRELADNTPAARWIDERSTLYVYRSQQEQQAEAASWALRDELGVRYESIDENALRELEPALSPAFRCALRLPGHGRALNPSKLVKAHAERLVERGGELLRRDVRAIEFVDGRATQLLTDQQPLPLDLLLVAAGPWSTTLSEQCGDPVPLEAEGGYHVTLNAPGVTLNHPLMVTSFKVAMTPMELGIRAGGLVEFAGLCAHDDVKPARKQLLLRAVRAVLPDADVDTLTEWRGNRPSLPDSLPVIGRSPRVENVYYAFGNQHVGLSSGPKTGKLITQLIAGQTPAIELEPFRVERFNW